NETFDFLAKVAIVIQTNNSVSIPFIGFRESFKHKCDSDTKKLIEEQSRTKGKEYFQFYYESNSELWFVNTGLTREVSVTIIRCRSDRYNFVASLSHVGIINETKCNCNYEKQDLNHIVRLSFNTQRLKLIKKLRKCQLFLSLNTYKVTTQSVKNCSVFICISL
ncbi:hypothetical protein WN55_05695, partial [Dufourea novaeangliae]